MLLRALEAKTYNVGSVEEAVELAAKLKREGHHDWFRGQTRPWQPISSIGRMFAKPVEVEKACDRLARFFSWISKTPGLEDLDDDLDAKLAIAQHHGMATHLLDFTTEPGVAGYFASEIPSAKNSPTGVIYCLNTSHLKEFWVKLKPHLSGQIPEFHFITAIVPNLWRLEAQHGVFLDAPRNWSDFYVLDKIYFPQNGPPSFPTKEDIYPKKKSPLELVLDQFFAADKTYDWHQMFRQVFPDATPLHLGSKTGVDAKFVKEGKLPVLRCWYKSKLGDWEAMPNELLRPTVSGEIRLQLNLRSEPSKLRKDASFGVKRALELNPELRKKAVRWLILPQNRLQSKLSQQLDSLWNGMRNLPYSDDDIAEAAGLCFALHRVGYSKAKDREEFQKLAQEVMGDVMAIECGSWEYNSSRGFMYSADLLNAVRSDIATKLREEYKAHASSIDFLLHVCYRPSRLFEFERLIQAFGRHFVPTQVMNPNNDAPIFSPAKLAGFGHP